jgi:prepilin-type N-terminal cleavage/methylation domain-containing protein
MKNEKGFSLLEVVITMAILSYAILGVISMQFAAMRANSHSGSLTEATNYASDRMERLMSVNYASLADGTDTEGDYSLSWDIMEDTAEGSVADGTKTVALTVTWTERGSQKTLSMRSVKPDLSG